MPNISELFHIGAAVLKTTVDDVTSTILAQIGSIAEEYVFSDNAEWWQHVGLASRPGNPIKGKSAAECVAIRGSRDAIIASRDVRGQAIYGNLGDGETCLYAGGKDGQAQGRVMIKGDGSITMMTTENNLPSSSGGKPVALRISPSGGLEFTSQFGSMVFDATGFHVKTAAGPRIDMGGLTIPGLGAIPGIGSLVSTMGSYATITAPFVNIAGATTTLGMGPLYNSAAVGLPAPPSPVTISPGIPASIASIASLTTSATVYVSQ